ncbi:MAG TPA: SDR family oxidoreductase [Thermoleophilaceae bacterium]|nr:SDR family oxidoreductase [Thermoleophilaceae bacterium]
MSLPRPSDQATALVTGASAGIGADLARGLAARGHHLTLVARRRERLEELADEVKQRFGAEAAVDPCDLGDEAQRKQLIQNLRRRRRRVAVLVNNAGFGTFGKFWKIDADREREEVRLNIQALHDLLLAFVPSMVERRSGAILNVGSTAGFQPLPGNTTYSATKAFVNTISEALHEELSGTGVGCTVLCPGPVATEFQESSGIGHLHAAGPSGIWATSEEVAQAAIEGMEKGKRVVLPRIADKVTARAGQHTPRSVLLPVMRRFGSRILRD